MQGNALEVRSRELNPLWERLYKEKIATWNAVEKAGIKEGTWERKKIRILFLMQPMQRERLLSGTSVLPCCQFGVIVKFYILYFFKICIILNNTKKFPSLIKFIKGAWNIISWDYGCSVYMEDNYILYMGISILFPLVKLEEQ